jgi:hypothetical protein
MVVQSKSQLDAQYGEEAAKSILQNANTKICLPGVTDADARMFSDLAGMTTVITTGQSGMRKTMDVLQDAGSRSRSEVSRALMPANDLRTMRGEVFAVLPAEHPIRAEQRPYYTDPRPRRLVPDPEETDVLAGLRRQYPWSDPGLGVEIPDQEEVEDAIETQQAEGSYVKTGDVVPKWERASANGNGHVARDTTVRSRVWSKRIDRRSLPAAAVSSAGNMEPEHHHEHATTPAPGPTNGTATPQPDGAAMLQEPHIRVLELLAEEKTLSQIAAELGYRPQTVKNYLTAIYSRLGVRTRGPQGRRDAVAIARERRVISREIEHSDDLEH